MVIHGVVVQTGWPIRWSGLVSPWRGKERCAPTGLPSDDRHGAAVHRNHGTGHVARLIGRKK